MVAQSVKNPPAMKETAWNIVDLGLISGLGRSPGGGNGNPLQYSCLENPRAEEPSGVQFVGLQESDMTSRQNHHHTSAR